VLPATIALALSLIYTEPAGEWSRSSHDQDGWPAVAHGPAHLAGLHRPPASTEKVEDIESLDGVERIVI
jgi:hypothetical protein